ncbi:hypothetical protein evm_011540 [Chilo suppressalis]|nr:hypothetical protein evm_011540 [Chilo suppressalis]
MEWSKDKTLKLIELLQLNASLWNPSLCETRRDKQKRKEELRTISDILGISVPDTTKKIQHLRTQYNRESARESRALAEDPNDRYTSNWYAFEYLHFMKDSSKPYRVLTQELTSESSNGPTHTENSIGECKLDSLSPPHKVPRTDSVNTFKVYPNVPRNRDEFTVFGEYIANELRSLKGWGKSLRIIKNCDVYRPSAVSVRVHKFGLSVFNPEIMISKMHVALVTMLRIKWLPYSKKWSKIGIIVIMT